jgi:hypothetical protein
MRRLACVGRMLAHVAPVAGGIDMHMRGAFAFVVVVGMLVSTAHADPFEIRNPVPDAPSRASSSDREPTVELVDPGYAQRRNGVLVAAGGGAFIGASALLSYAMSVRFDAALARLEAGDDPQRATDDALRAQRIARNWGTGLFVAGAVAVGVGAYLYLSAPMKIRRERVVVVPAIDSNGAGFAIAGGF